MDNGPSPIQPEDSRAADQWPDPLSRFLGFGIRARRTPRPIFGTVCVLASFLPLVAAGGCAYAVPFAFFIYLPLIVSAGLLFWGGTLLYRGGGGLWAIPLLLLAVPAGAYVLLMLIAIGDMKVL